MIGDMETERVEALRRYAVLDTPCEREFEELAALAAQICRTPLAAIGLMDAEREWFKATVGMSVTEVPRAKSLGAEAIQQNDVLVVNDTFSDARFRDKFLRAGSCAPRSASSRMRADRRHTRARWRTPIAHTSRRCFARRSGWSAATTARRPGSD
jgi:GAF domain-containing protein